MATFAAAAPGDVLTAKDAASLPRPCTAIPGRISFTPAAPGGKRSPRGITCLHSSAGSLGRQLFHFATPAGNDAQQTLEKSLLVQPPDNTGDTEQNLSLEEKLRRERQRMMATGVTNYSWVYVSNEIQRVMIPLQGNVYVQDCNFDTGKHGSLRLVFEKQSTGANGGAIDPQMSPCGTRLAFVQENEIYMCDICEDGEQPCPAVQVTDGARGNGLMNGLADFIAQEEMDRYRGFWWSPDGKSIAFEQVDESHIPIYRIMHQGNDGVGPDSGAQEDHRYPFAGKANPKVKLAVIAVEAINKTNAATAEVPKPQWLNLVGNTLQCEHLLFCTIISYAHYFHVRTCRFLQTTKLESHTSILPAWIGFQWTKLIMIMDQKETEMLAG